MQRPITYRYLVYAASALRGAILGAMMSSMSFAWVCMTNRDVTGMPNTLNASSDNALDIANTSIGLSLPTFNRSALVKQSGKLDWGPQEQQWIFAANGVGELVMAVPAGWFVSRFGSRISASMGCGAAGVMTILIPVLAQYSFALVALLRLIVGMGMSLIGPVSMNIGSWWVPKNEIGTASAISRSAIHLGKVAQLLIGGVECDTIGWQWIFYISGAVGILYSVFWFILFRDDPSAYRSISTPELQHIEDKRARKAGKKHTSKIPWKGILTSLPVWSCIICRFCITAVLRGVSQFIPTYVNDTLSLPASLNGAVSALPSFVQILGRMVGGPVSDREWLSHNARVKIVNTVSFLGAGSCILGLAFVNSSTPVWVPILLLTLTMFLAMLNGGGFSKAPLFIAAEYSPVVSGFMNISGALGTIIMPFIVDSLTADKTP